MFSKGIRLSVPGSQRACWVLVAAAALILPSAAWCSTQTLQELPQDLPAAATQYVQLTDATVLDREHARNLILNTLVGPPRFGLTQAAVDNNEFYCIIHVVRWTDVSKGTVDKQNWYVYRGGPTKGNPPKLANTWTLDDFQAARMYGTKGFWLLYVHANTESKGYEVEYDSAVTGKIRANLANLFALAQTFTTSPAGLNAALAGSDTVFGGTFFQSSVPADIAISAKKLPVPGAAAAAPQVIADSQKFDNESKYVIDFSVGVPIKKVSELSFNSSANSVSPSSTTVSDRKALALIDIHIPPVDVKSQAFSLIPYGVAGVAIAQQPLHQILAGIGWGPQFANFYLGALWVKQPNTPVAGQPGTSSFTPQLSFGLNLTVSSFTSLKK